MGWGRRPGLILNPGSVACFKGGQMGKVESPFLTAAEAAKYLRVSLCTLYRWCEDKAMGLPVRYHGKRMVFVSSELDAWSNRQTA